MSPGRSPGESAGKSARPTPLQIALRALGTLALALGFLVLVGRTPFLPADPKPAAQGPTAVESRAGGPIDAPHLKLPNLNLDPLTYDQGAMPEDAFPALRAQSAGAPLEPTMGLFKARFNQTDDSPGFASEEHRVPGACEGAGRRYVDELCPDCQVREGEGSAAMPDMLMWSHFEDEESVFRAVTRDCIFVSPDGLSVIGSLRFGTGMADLTRAEEELALDVVPLIPGAKRLAAVEEGGWLATFDEVTRPSTALADMATRLRNRGWRESRGTGGDDLQAFEGQRVFTNHLNNFCVISLSEKDFSHQLLTVMDSKVGG